MAVKLDSRPDAPSDDDARRKEIADLESKFNAPSARKPSGASSKDPLEEQFSAPSIQARDRNAQQKVRPEAPVDPRSRQVAEPEGSDTGSDTDGDEYIPPAPTGSPSSSPGDDDFIPPDARAEDRSESQPPAPGSSVANKEANPEGGKNSARMPGERNRFGDRINNSKSLNQIKSDADKIQNTIQDLKKGAKAAKTGVQAGKAGAQAAGAASGAATAGVGTAATVGEAAVETFAKQFKKRVIDGDFSVSKKTIIAVMIPIIFAGIFAVGLIMLPKFAAKTFSENVRRPIMSRVNYALENRANLYLQDYAKDVLLPNLEQCGTVINTDCYAGRPGPTTRHQTLYDAWRKGGLEAKIQLRYDITFQDGGTGNYEDIRVLKEGKIVQTYKNYFDTGLALQHVMGATEASGVNQRWLMRHTLNSRFGEKWCVVLCADEDALTNENLDVLSKMRLKVSSRVLAKSAARISALLQCGPSCTPEILATAAKTAAKQALAVADSKFLRELFEDLGPLAPIKFVSYLADKVLENLFSKQGIVRAAKFAFDLPVTAWHTVTSVISGSIGFIQGLLDNKEINEFVSEKNMSEFVDASSTIDSAIDEASTGKAPIRQQGAVFRYLRNANRDRMVQKVRNVYPLSANKCDDGTILQGDDAITCVDKHVIRDYDAAGIKDNTRFGFFGRALDAITNKLSFLPIIGTRLESAADWALNVQDSTEYIAENVAPPVYSTEPAGETTAGAVTVGGYFVDVNAYFDGGEDIDGGWIGMAGEWMSAEKQASLDVAIAQANDKKLQHQSLYARYLDPGNPTSLFSTTMMDFAFAMPVLIDEPMKINFNPFGFIGNLGMALGFSQKASAQGATALGDWSQYHKIPAMGYTKEALMTDPKLLTPEYCTKSAEDRKASIQDIGDGRKLATVADLCPADDMTILALTAFQQLKSLDALEAYFKEPLKKQASTPIGGISDVPPREQNTTNTPCAPAPEGFTLAERSPVGVTGGTQIRLCSYGTGAWVNSSWSNNVTKLFAAARRDGIDVGGGAWRDSARQISLRRSNCGSSTYAIYEMPASACNPPTAKPGTSNHEFGLAIDFSQITGTCGARRGVTVCPASKTFQWLTANGATYGFKKLSTEAWHWSVDGR